MNTKVETFSLFWEKNARNFCTANWNKGYPSITLSWKQKLHPKKKKTHTNTKPVYYSFSLDEKPAPLLHESLWWLALSRFCAIQIQFHSPISLWLFEPIWDFLEGADSATWTNQLGLLQPAAYDTLKSTLS